MYFAAGSYQYHFCRRKWGLSLDMQQLLALILRQENVPVQDKLSSGKSACRVFLLRCFWAGAGRGRNHLSGNVP